MATELAKAYVQIIPSAKGIKAMLEKGMGGEAAAAGKSAGKSLGDGILSGLANIGKAAAAALSAATAAVGAFAGASVKTGMAFDSAMSQVAATMGDIDDMGAEAFDRLKESAREMGIAFDDTTTATELTGKVLREFAQEQGASTAFSATQAAEALNFMALAGYDAEQSMAALPNVLNLAAAGGIDLAAASDMVTDAQSALGLTMDESAALVDKMAMASSRSNTSVAQLGDAILTIGGTAKTLAGGTTELSTALGILADNGVKGAEGGTALRNIILSLSAPTNTAAKEMRALGLNVFDTEGNMRPLEEVFGDLNGILSDMTQGEQTQVLSELFNKVDLKSVNALLATDAERWGELTAAIDNADGAAQRMADTQLDNLAGDITLFQSALEGAQIVLSDQLTPNLREFVQFGTDGITQIADGFKEGGLSGAMEAFGTVLSDGLGMITQQLPGFVSAGMQLLGALGKGLISNFSVLIESAKQIITELASGLVQALPALASGALQIITMLANGIMEALPLLSQAAMDIIGQLTEGLAENLPTMIEQGLQMILSLSGSLRENASMLVDAAITLIQTLADGLIEALPAFIETAPLILSEFASLLIDNVPTLLETAAELIVQLSEALASPDSLGNLIDSASQVIFSLADGLITALPTLLEKAPIIIDNLVTAIANNLPKIMQTGIELLVKLTLGIVNAIPQLVSKVPQIITSFINGIKTCWSNIFNIGKDILSKVGEGLKSVISDAKTWGSDMLQGFINGITSKLSALWDSVKGIASGIANFLHFSRPDEGPLRDYETWMPDFMQGLAQGIDSNVWRVQKAIKGLTQDMTLDLSPSVQMPSLHAAAVADTSAALGGGTVTNLYQTINTHDSLSESELTREAEDMLERGRWKNP